MVMSDWSGIGVCGGWGDDATNRLLAENARLLEHGQRLGRALSRMAGELARARQENLVLKQENLRMGALLAGSGTSRKSPHG